MAHGDSDLTPDPLHARIRAATGRAGGDSRRTPECPDPADIATLVTSDGEAAAAFLSHASTCDYCGPLVDAAVSGMTDRDDDRALLDELHTASPEWRKQMSFRLAAAGKKAPRTNRSLWWTVAATAAAAAAIVIAIRVAGPSVTRPELRDLVAAVSNEAQRPVDGRLTGGFVYAAPPTLLRGPTAEASPRVRMAAAALEEAVRANDTAVTQAAVGAGFLAVGELDKAVAALESAVLQSPDDARYQSDLSAAYLARAKWTDRAEDWPKALAAAERAVKADPTLVEAQFNRALALEGIHLIDEAIEAWTSYQSIETDSRWRGEADEHTRSLRQRLAVPKPQSNQDLRERIEDELLAKWGEAALAGDMRAAQRLLDEADAAATQLVTAGGDAMARDEIALIRRVMEESATLTSLATAHATFGKARREFLANQLHRSAELMEAAATGFAAAGSPYAVWGTIFRAIDLWVSGSVGPALVELRSLVPDRWPGGHLNLRGRYHWTVGVAEGLSGKHDRQRVHMRHAIEAYSHANESENLTAVQIGLAEAEWLLGDMNAAWSHAVHSMERLPELKVSARRNLVLFECTVFSLSDGLPDTALRFQNALIRSLGENGQAFGRVDAYLRRARVLARLGQRAAALEDFARAQTTIGTIADAGLQTRTAAELNSTKAELFATSDPADAIEAATAALPYFEAAGPLNKIAELLAWRARSRESLGDIDAARRDYHAAIDALDGDRARLARPQDRLQAFEQRRTLYQDVVRFEAVVNRDSMAALRIAERGLSRALLENTTGPNNRPLDPEVAHRRLPANVAVILQSGQADQMFVWVLTREGIQSVAASASVSAITVRATQLRRRIDQGAGLAGIASDARYLYEHLVDPIMPFAHDKTVLVFVSDGVLSALPLAALIDKQGHPLIETHVVAIAPSVTTFMLASARLEAFAPRSVTAIGDGHDAEALKLPRLAMADAEAAAIGRTYAVSTVLLGADATRERFLAANGEVVHFAGHSVMNDRFPFLASMLFAPGHDDSGVMLAADLAAHRFTRTKLLVLATCDGAAGKAVAGEGVLSLARVFLDGGVPSVIASRWPVDDASHPLLLALHEEIVGGRDGAAALRASQLRMLREQPAAPVRVWAGFTALGGVTGTD